MIAKGRGWTGRKGSRRESGSCCRGRKPCRTGRLPHWTETEPRLRGKRAMIDREKNMLGREKLMVLKEKDALGPGAEESRAGETVQLRVGKRTR